MKLSNAVVYFLQLKASKEYSHEQTSTIITFIILWLKNENWQYIWGSQVSKHVDSGVPSCDIK
jgi:hypothetical protein